MPPMSPCEAQGRSEAITSLEKLIAGCGQPQADEVAVMQITPALLMAAKVAVYGIGVHAPPTWSTHVVPI